MCFFNVLKVYLREVLKSKQDTLTCESKHDDDRATINKARFPLFVSTCRSMYALSLLTFVFLSLFLEILNNLK